jgi:predicted dehydrogenase
VGGGSLYDVGCYTVDLARLIMGGKPKEVYNTFDRLGKNKVDQTGEALLRYENDVTFKLTYSFNSFAHKDFTAVGSQGKVIVEDLFEWFPEDDRTIELITDDQYEIFTFKVKNPYVLEIEGIYDHIINQKALPEDLNASLDNMIIIDHLFESAKKNVPVKL